MIRRLFTLAAAGSLALGVLSAAAWARTEHHPWRAQFRRAGVLWAVTAAGGHIALDNEPQRSAEAAQAHRELGAAMHECVAIDRQYRALTAQLKQAADPDRPALEARLADVRATAAANRRLRGSLLPRLNGTTPSARRSVPLWGVSGAAAALPFLWMGAAGRRRLVARRRKRLGQCAACGYDLRESVDRCPECGRTM